MPALTGDGDRDGAQVLASGMVHAACVSLIFRAEHTLGVAGLGRQLRCCDGLGVLFRFAEVDCYIQIAVLGGRFPPHILLDAVAADVVGILGEVIIPVGSSLRALPVQLSKSLMYFAGWRRQDSHQLGVKEIPAGDVIVTDIPRHSIIQQPLKHILQTHGFRLGGLVAVQLHSLQQLIGHIDDITRLNQLLV